METFMAAILIIIAMLLLPYLKTIEKNLKEFFRYAGKRAPGPWSLPIIGNIHKVLGPLPPHHYLRQLSSLYGPVMLLKLGEINTLIISSAEGAREIMKTHDLDFASRPATAATNTIFYDGNDIIFGRYGEFWRQMRRICMNELLCAKQVRCFQTIREEEISHLLQSISATAGEVVDLSSKLATLSNNIAARTVIGGTCKEQLLFQLALDEAVQYVSGFTISNLFPSIPSFINRIAGWQKQLDRCGQKLDRIAEKILQEHIQKQAKLLVNGCKVEDKSFIENDMIDVLIRIQRDGSLQFPLSNDNIKAVVNDMLMAGSETTSTTMEWVMTELVRHPEVMRKVQREVRNILGEGGNTNMTVNEEAVRNKLHYLQLVIKETLRLHTPVPLLLPRENDERLEVMGYDIPAKTTVIVNAWAIGRDPKYWEKPDEFWPERFLKNDVDFKGAYFEFLPFGSGRRMCPGIHFGLAVVELTIAHLLYYFDWEYKSKKGEQLDAADTFGVTARRKSSLCLLAIPHIPLNN